MLDVEQEWLGHTALMGWEETERQQDDLIREDSAGSALKRLAKGAKGLKPGVTADERLYTDHNAGEVGLSPDSDVSRKARKMRAEGPVKQSWLARTKLKLSGAKQTWSEAVSDAEQKQQKRREKRGKH